MDRDSSNQRLVLESAELPDLFEWERRPGTQMVPEKTVIASPYVGGSKDKPRDIRTLRRQFIGDSPLNVNSTEHSPGAVGFFG